MPRLQHDGRAYWHLHPHPTPHSALTLMLSIPPLGQEYKLLFEGAGSNPGDKTLEDRFFEHEVRGCSPVHRREGLVARA